MIKCNQLFSTLSISLQTVFAGAVYLAGAQILHKGTNSKQRKVSKISNRNAIAKRMLVLNHVHLYESKHSRAWLLHKVFYSSTLQANDAHF
jgi:ABC-type cobalamin/Fe3+-siderophores transport system ATPase subunit